MNNSENLTKQQKFSKSKLRVSINLPDNEISLLKIWHLSFSEGRAKEDVFSLVTGKSPLRSSKVRILRVLRSGAMADGDLYRSHQTVLEVLRELDADVLALQDVKAKKEKNMKPLSDMAATLGMNYVFAESWAPEYGNAILSKWPIKRPNVKKIFDNTDFRFLTVAGLPTVTRFEFSWVASYSGFLLYPDPQPPSDLDTHHQQPPC